MPRFLGKDYYNIAITEKNAFLYKKMLYMPHHLTQHSGDCCISKDDFLACFLDKFTEDQLPDDELDTFKHLFLKINVLRMETFEEDIMFNLIGDEFFEIIPSSNPESEHSNLSLDIDGVLDLKFMNEHSDIKHSISMLNEFLPRKKLSGNTFEVPLCNNELDKAIVQLPSTSFLLSRLTAVELSDPLLKQDGSEWKETDFFIRDLTLTNDDKETEDQAFLFNEKFKKMSLESPNNNLFEELLSPNIISKEDSDLVQSIHLFGVVFKELQSDWVDQNFNLTAQEQSETENMMQILSQGMNSEIIISKLEEPINLTFKSFLEINNAENQNEDSLCMNLLTDSILELIPTKLVYETEKPIDLIQFTVQSLALTEINLDLNHSPLITNKLLQVMNNNIWEKEKHFDEMQIPEPKFPAPTLPDLISEVIECQRLTQDDCSAEEEKLPWSFDVVCEQIPFLQVLPEMTIDHPAKPPECFSKFSLSDSELLYWSENDTSEEKVNICKHKQDFIEDKEVYFQETIVLDPLESFIQVRANVRFLDLTGAALSDDMKKAVELIENQVSSVTTELVKNKVDTVTTTAKAETNLHKTEKIKMIDVPISDGMDEVIDCIESCAAPYFDQIQKKGLVSSNETFLSLTADYARFLLKEDEKQNSERSQGCDKLGEKNKNLTTSLNVIFILRSAIELLIHSCLESCITWITSQIESGQLSLEKTFHELRGQLFALQCNFYQNKKFHPKMESLCQEIKDFLTQFPGAKVLLLVQRGQPNLLSAVHDLLVNIWHIDVSCASETTQCLSLITSTVLVTPYVEFKNIEDVNQFSLVIQYDEQLGDFYKKICKDRNISYIGLSMKLNYRIKEKVPLAVPEEKTDIALICSTTVTQYKHLVYLLEAKHNILVIERDYNKRCLRVCFPDIIISTSHCAVLLGLKEIEGQLSFEEVVHRFVALGLQFSHCYVLLHGFDSNNSYLLNKETENNIYKLRAALANLSAASENFTVQFKVLITLTEEDAAKTIRDIVNIYINTHSNSDLLRNWLTTDFSEDEEFLLQVPCLNSFSAQLLLKNFTLQEILEKNEEDLKAMVPEIPEKIIKYLHYCTLDWKEKNSLSGSQVSANGNSEKSFNSYSLASPTYSPLSDVDQDSTVSLSPAAYKHVSSSPLSTCGQPYCGSPHIKDQVKRIPTGSANPSCIESCGEWMSVDQSKKNAPTDSLSLHESVDRDFQAPETRSRNCMSNMENTSKLLQSSSIGRTSFVNLSKNQNITYLQKSIRGLQDTHGMGRSVLQDTHSMERSVLQDTHGMGRSERGLQDNFSTERSVLQDTHSMGRSVLQDTHSMGRSVLQDTHSMGRSVLQDTHSMERSVLQDTHGMVRSERGLQNSHSIVVSNFDNTKEATTYKTSKTLSDDNYPIYELDESGLNSYVFECQDKSQPVMNQLNLLSDYQNNRNNYNYTDSSRSFFSLDPEDDNRHEESWMLPQVSRGYGIFSSKASRNSDPIDTFYNTGLNKNRFLLPDDNTVGNSSRVNIASDFSRRPQQSNVVSNCGPALDTNRCSSYVRLSADKQRCHGDPGLSANQLLARNKKYSPEQGHGADHNKVLGVVSPLSASHPPAWLYPDQQSRKQNATTTDVELFARGSVQRLNHLPSSREHVRSSYGYCSNEKQNSDRVNPTCAQNKTQADSKHKVNIGLAQPMCRLNTTDGLECFQSMNKTKQVDMRSLYSASPPMDMDSGQSQDGSYTKHYVNEEKLKRWNSHLLNITHQSKEANVAKSQPFSCS
ncbi:uncharacterized protein LOC131945904 isoform X2 [Physella acuta]|uniref:uncharacterized protein LOC131945904 isoform X2 n=1 Tax=Physella acuta TaxID=109671 RepID=UPI0027DAF5CF|nr:uncharacterized protein LOC131945904 isoform X2 [Physella acuta]